MQASIFVGASGPSISSPSASRPVWTTCRLQPHLFATVREPRPGDWQLFTFQLVVTVSDQEKRCQDLLFSYGVHPVYEAKPPASWRSYVRQWLQRHQIPGEFALTHGPAEDAGHRMEVIEL